MNTDEARRLLLQQLLMQHAGAAPMAVPEAPPPAVRVAPASFAQRRLWFVEQLQQVQAPYTLHAVQQLFFAVDAQRLEGALRQIALRHDVLRTTFELLNDEVIQRIAPEPQLTLKQVDLAACPAGQREHEAKQRMTQTLAQRFDLRTGPLLRAELYTLGPQEALLLVAVHHIVFDWQSFQIFFQELDALYAAALQGRTAALPALPEQYAAFALAQRERLTPARIDAGLAFWRTELAGLPMLDLPLDRPRSRLPSFRGDQRTITLPAALVQRLQRRAQATQATLFTVLLAGLAAALGRVCRQQDFALGLPLTGRDTPARQQAIGFFVDTLVVRLRWADDPCSDDLLAVAREAMHRVLTHRDLPFDLLVQHLGQTRDLGVNPLFQVGFQLMQATMSQADSHGTDPARLSAMFDLCIDLWPQGDEVHGRLQFNADIFDPETVLALGQALTAALHWLAEPGLRWSALAFDTRQPGFLPALLAGEVVPLREPSCLALIAEVATRHPDAIALEDAEGQVLSYRALLPRVQALAGALAARGAVPGTVVLLELPRSLELVLLQLAAWCAGAAFACVDPAWPAERRLGVRQRTAAPLAVDMSTVPALMAAAGGPRLAWPGPRDAAYMITTSGSTGEPKTVVVEHLGLLNVALAQRRMFGLGAGRRVAQISSPTFDASVFELAMALCSGATLAIAPPGIVAGDALSRFLQARGVDAVVIPPSLLATVEPAHCVGLHLVCVAGEACPADLAERYGVGRTFWNLYGPTETTIWATAGCAAVGARLSIGGPIANLATAVVDEQGRVVPTGMTGELCVAGAGVARGYLHAPEQTARAFIPAAAELAALGHERMYRTGDLVRQLRQGELVFLGRIDRQVKVRGLRIEPEEIEVVLRAQSGVADVVVDAVLLHGEPVLVAYVQTAVVDERALFDACRQRLRERLPAYMCPSHFVALASFPRSSSGKVDRASLPPPGADAAPIPTILSPASETERMLAGLIQQLLHRPHVAMDDDFFRIGGHSLAAARLAARVQAALGVELSIADVFAHSTVSTLASRVDELKSKPAVVVDDIPLVRLPRAQAR
ncbi:non-ribosomal peptide synthetase [Roseateles sp. P5_D6]